MDSKWFLSAINEIKERIINIESVIRINNVKRGISDIENGKRYSWIKGSIIESKKVDDSKCIVINNVTSYQRVIVDLYWIVL